MLVLKSSHLENQQETRAKNYEDEIGRLREINETLQLQFEGDKQGSSSEIDRYRRENAEMERQYQD